MRHFNTSTIATLLVLSVSMSGCDEGSESEMSNAAPSEEKGDDLGSSSFERADEDSANELLTVGEQSDYREPYPADGFAPKNCAYFKLRPDDGYLGLDSTKAQHEVCLLSTYQQVKHRIITTDIADADRDLYDRHGAYVDRFTVTTADGTPLSETYDVSCNGEDCATLFAADPTTRTPIFDNVKRFFNGNSDVRLSLSGGGWLEISFFVPRAGSSMIPDRLVVSELPRFGEPERLVRYAARENPDIVRMAEIEYVRGLDVTTENALGFGCETADGAQHEAQRFMVRTRERERQLFGDDQHIEIQGLLNAEYNEDGDPTQGYFSVHAVCSPVPDADPGATPTQYFHERIVVPKGQDCEILSIAGQEVDVSDIQAAQAEDPAMAPWFEAEEAKVAPDSEEEVAPE